MPSPDYSCSPQSNPTGYEGILRSNERFPLSGPSYETAVDVPHDRLSFVFTAPLFTNPVVCCIQLYGPDGALLPGGDSRAAAKVRFHRNEDTHKTVTFSGFGSTTVCLFEIWLEDASHEGDAPANAEISFTVFV